MKNQKKLIILTGPAELVKEQLLKKYYAKKKIFGFQYLQRLENREMERRMAKITTF